MGPKSGIAKCKFPRLAVSGEQKSISRRGQLVLKLKLVYQCDRPARSRDTVFQVQKLL